MKIRDGKEDAYAHWVEINSADDYSKCVVDWTEAFGALLGEGRTDYESMARDSARGLGGPTFYMYGCMIAAIAAFHPEGERVRRWHNLNIQIGDEGEKANQSGSVLNPALLTMSEPKKPQ